MTAADATIGRYKIKSKLGEGAAGIVYKAEDPVLQRTVAIKVPKSKDFTAEDYVQKAKDFYREAVVGGQFQHENIVTIYDVGKDSEIDFLVMEYVDGISMRKHLKQAKQLSIDYVVDAVYKLCIALDYMHFNKIVHRDIKPDNIMVNVDNNVIKLMDFSCSSRLAELTRDRSGSAPYMAPEIHNIDEIIDLQSDIFSLGAVMYELLTGNMAFRGEDAMSCVYKVIHDDPVPVKEIRPEVPDSLVEILDRALQKKPQDRFQTVIEFADALKKAKSPGDGVIHSSVNKNDQYVMLRKDEWFKNFSPDQVSELMDAGEVKLYGDKQIILQEGRENNTFYLVLEGSVSVMKGKRKIRSLGEGECFGEMSYLTDVATTASIRANGDVMIWEVTPGHIENLSCKSQLGFQKAFIEMIVQRLQRGTNDIVKLQEMLYKAKKATDNK
jgi:eukaryotic-like serine/threonine-protein kinase